MPPERGGRLRPLRDFPPATWRSIRYLLTDYDGTLTSNGRLPAAGYSALQRLQQTGLVTVLVTGGPAGMGHHMARSWPLDATIAESGAVYYRYQTAAARLITRYWKSDPERDTDRDSLNRLKQQILSQVPGAALASDQTFRVADLAIDIREDVNPPLPAADIERIVAIFEQGGARAKVSSIHVNGWFGDYDKLAMSKILFREQFGVELDRIREQAVFVGDAANDALMFEFFPHSVGVANVRDYLSELTPAQTPAWVTEQPATDGFIELANTLCRYR